MLRLLVVDDEPVQLMNLIGTIQILKPAYIIFSAKNGRHALEMLKSFPVDLMITDIRMPVMDGLSLIQEAKKLYAELYTVILSGYGEFEYARKGIELGVDGYLLKTLEQEELLKIMDMLETKLLDRRESFLDKQVWQRTRQQLDQERAEREAENFFLGHGRAPERPALRAITGPEDSGVLFCARRKGGLWDEAAAATWKNRFCALLSEYGSTYTLRCKHQQSDIVTVLHTGTPLPEAFFDHLRKWCLDIGDDGVVLGVSTFTPKLSSHADAAFRQATEACEYVFYTPSESLYRYRRDAAMQPYLLGHIRLPLDKVQQYLMIGNAEDAASLLVQELHAYVQEHSPYPSKLKEVLIFCFWRICNDATNAIGDDIHGLLEDVDGKITASDSLADMEDGIRSLCEEFCSRLRNQRRSATDQAMDSAAEILRAEYAREWSLDELSDRLHFNPSYFSTLFKQHFGMGYSDYLNDVRMERAAALLREGNIRIGDLARKVGYQNPTYFIKLFRKKYGLTPNEFKRGSLHDKA